MDSDEVIRQLEGVRAEYEARIAILEAERERLYHALGTATFEIKSLESALMVKRIADMEAE